MPKRDFFTQAHQQQKYRHTDDECEEKQCDLHSPVSSERCVIDVGCRRCFGGSRDGDRDWRWIGETTVIADPPAGDTVPERPKYRPPDRRVSHRQSRPGRSPKKVKYEPPTFRFMLPCSSHLTWIYGSASASVKSRGKTVNSGDRAAAVGDVALDRIRNHNAPTAAEIKSTARTTTPPG